MACQYWILLFNDHKMAKQPQNCPGKRFSVLLAKTANHSQIFRHDFASHKEAFP